MYCIYVYIFSSCVHMRALQAVVQGYIYSTYILPLGKEEKHNTYNFMRTNFTAHKVYNIFHCAKLELIGLVYFMEI